MKIILTYTFNCPTQHSYNPFLYPDSSYTVIYSGLPIRVSAVTWESIPNENPYAGTMFCYRTIGWCQLHDITDQPLQMGQLKFIGLPCDSSNKDTCIEFFKPLVMRKIF